jgi:hypothetical protein
MDIPSLFLALPLGIEEAQSLAVSGCRPISSWRAAFAAASVFVIIET